MSIAPINLDLLDHVEIKEISKEVAFRSSGLTNKIIKDDVFNILEEQATVLYYPIEETEICAFYKKIQEKKFVFINTNIPYEKQIFAAAHELAHLWNVATTEAELLKIEVVDEYIGDRHFVVRNEKLENLANRFAAEFLVQKEALEQELRNMNSSNSQVDLGIIIRLMDKFVVPYKTIVRRLYEIEYVNRELCEKLLAVERLNIERTQKRLQLCEKNNAISQRVKLGNLVDLALQSYEQGLRTYEKLEALLGLVKESPEYYGIQKKTVELMTEEELDRYLDSEDD